MNIYITGASGFLGKTLLRKLESVETKVIPIVRNSINHESEILFDFTKATEDQIFNVLRDADCIIHLAAHPNFDKTFNAEVYDVNCLANLKLINAARSINAHFIFASNALISGIGKEYIDAETADCPEIPYNIAKYLSEEYLKDRIENYSVLRIGGIYGYNGPKHLYLNKAIVELAHHNKLPVIRDNGIGKRNYIYVEDLSNWIINIIEKKSYGKILIGGYEVLPIKSILKELCEEFNKNKFELEVNEEMSGSDQVIQCNFPDIKMHTYREAFSQISLNI